MKEYIKYREQFSYRDRLYNSISKKFYINKALYPGSYIDIAPSIFIPDMTYVDNYKGAITFFKSLDEIKQYINIQKKYKVVPKITFFGNDYSDDLPIDTVDLIISQYAGFVGQATKKHLKQGGILVANDSHGDATLAYLDSDFEFIGVATAEGKISDKNLEQYFTFKRPRPIDKEKVIRTMKGPKYSILADNYIFRYFKK